jgi:hypothetical protein
MEIIGLRCQRAITFGCCGADTRAEITALAETHSGRDRAKAHECKHHLNPALGAISVPT